MASTKTKTAISSKAMWPNQVVRVSDGRLIVRGVDVPASGPVWESVYAGKPPPPDQRVSPPGAERALIVVTSKSKALAIAKQAGLVVDPKKQTAKK